MCDNLNLITSGEISEMWVKMQEGPMMTVPTLLYVMKHLPRCKGKGPCGDVYEHYQAMPQDLVHDMCHRALNGRISEGFATLWRSGLLHIGDKERLDSRGLKDGRPITVGLALRRITGRIPCAQRKACNNTCEYNHRYTVTYTSLCYLLSQPY